MQCLIQLPDFRLKSLTLIFVVALVYNSINLSISVKTGRSKFLLPHDNDILIAARNPECDDTHHQTKILILPVFVPHSRQEPEVEIMNLNQFNTPYGMKSKRNQKNQWKETTSSNDEKETQFSLAKFLENPKANYILGNDIGLNQAGILSGDKLNAALLGSSGDDVGNKNGGGGGLTLALNGGGGQGDGLESDGGKIPLLTELIVKSVLAGQRNFDWDYAASDGPVSHISPETSKSNKTIIKTRKR